MVILETQKRKEHIFRMIRKPEVATHWCAHKSFSVVMTFSGEVETGKWGNVVFVQIQTAEVYFPTQRYISRPQRCIFKHFTHQPGASFVYYLLENQENWAEKSKGKSGERALNCNILMVDAELWDRRKQFHILKNKYHFFSLFEEQGKN